MRDKLRVVDLNKIHKAKEEICYFQSYYIWAAFLFPACANEHQVVVRRMHVEVVAENSHHRHGLSSVNNVVGMGMHTLNKKNEANGRLLCIAILVF